MKIFSNNYYLAAEFALLFFGIPVFIMAGTNIIHPSRLLLPVVVLIFIYLLTRSDFSIKKMFHLHISADMLFKNALIFVAVACLLTGYVYFFERKHLFNLPSENTRLWVIFFFFYPVFSALLQEIVYRSFLFRRYKKLFRHPTGLILASGITFGFVHILYYHPISIILTLILGIYLGYLYRKTRSVLFTSIVHGVYGNLVFSIGLGHYFWLDIHKYL